MHLCQYPPAFLAGLGLLFILDSEEPAEEADEEVPFLGLLRLGIRVRCLGQRVFGNDKRIGWCQQAIFLQEQRIVGHPERVGQEAQRVLVQAERIGLQRVGYQLLYA